MKVEECPASPYRVPQFPKQCSKWLEGQDNVQCRNGIQTMKQARKLYGPGTSTLGALQGPWKDQGRSLTIWDLAFVSLESLYMFFVAQNAKNIAYIVDFLQLEDVLIRDSETPEW